MVRRERQRSIRDRNVQLYEDRKKKIKAGTLSAFTRLRAKRKLACYLQVSKNTIEEAYEQLLAEGYIE